MRRLRQAVMAAARGFGRWGHSPQVWMAFALGFIACFLLSGRVVDFSREHGGSLQLLEPFIWVFGDSGSILLISLCLLLLFSDLPHLDNETPLFLVRTTRLCWMAGQVLYLALSTLVFVGFILLSTCVLTGAQAYKANLWSRTAAILGYSSIGESLCIPAFVKVLELTFPYPCALRIFALMLGYSLALSSVIFFFNLLRDKLGMAAGAVFSGFGLFLTPDVLSRLLGLTPQQSAGANILFGWLSPLNHATYYMHNFGYDSLPRLIDSYLFFALWSGAFFGLCFHRVRGYAFHFTGTEG